MKAQLNPNWIGLQVGSLWLLGGLALIGTPSAVLGIVALIVALTTLTGSVAK